MHTKGELFQPQQHVISHASNATSPYKDVMQSESMAKVTLKDDEISIVYPVSIIHLRRCRNPALPLGSSISVSL